MNNEIARIDSGPLTKVQVVAQKRLIQEVMEAVMKDGTHYGIIPGCKQPSLYKAGSESILSTFRIAVEPTVEDLSTSDCYRYRVTCRGIIPTGEIVGAGVGEASTDEEKYKWRGAVCDEEFAATPEDRRRVKWNKGAYGKPAYQVNQVRTTPADLANTVLKMAKKRAQIDLTLTATGASDVFAQDLEDLPEEVRDEFIREEGGGQKSGKPAVTQPQTKTATAETGEKATEGQVKILGVKMKQAGISETDFLAHFKLAAVADMLKSQVNGALKSIADGEIKKGEVAAETLPDKCSNCGEIEPNHHPDCSYAEN